MNRKVTPLGRPGDGVHNAAEEEYRVSGQSQTDLEMLIKKLLAAKLIEPMDAFLEPEDIARVLRKRLDKLAPLNPGAAVLAGVANRGPKPLGLPGY